MHRVKVPGEVEDISAISPGLLAGEFVVETPDSAFTGLADLRDELSRSIRDHDVAQWDSNEERALVRNTLDRMSDLGVSVPNIERLYPLERYINTLLSRPGVEGIVRSDRLKHERIRAQKDRVRGMQQMLAAQGFYEGDPDGVYDEKTVKAIRAAQAAGVNVPPTAPQ